MKYTAPYGSSDPNAPYVNGNPSTGTAGSIPPAAAFEQPQRELVALITAAGFTPADAALTQVALAVQKGLNYAAATGGANAWAITLPLAPLAYAAGLRVIVIAPGTNTSSSVTANINSLGTKPVKKRDGTDPAVGDIVGGVAYPTIYDGTNIRILTPLLSDVTAQIAASKSPFNVQQTTFGTRTSLSGTGFVNFQTGSYTKKSATSDLIVSTKSNLFAGGAAQAGIMRVTLGAQTIESVCLNGTSSDNAPAANAEKKLSGLAAGSLSFAIAYGRTDGLSWTSIINPTSADSGGLPAQTTMCRWLSRTAVVWCAMALGTTTKRSALSQEPALLVSSRKSTAPASGRKIIKPSCQCHGT